MADTGSPRRTRPFVAVLGGVFTVAGALLLPFVIAVTHTSRRSSPDIDMFSSAVVVAVLGVLPLALGLWLLHVGVPTLFRGFSGQRSAASRERPAGALKRALGMLRPRRSDSPVSRVVLALALAGVAYIVLPEGARWLGIFVAFTGYALGDPLINAFNPHWWINTLLSLLGFIGLFVVAGLIGEIDEAGETGMLFMAPLMAYPFAIGISGLIRLVRWRRLASQGSTEAVLPSSVSKSPQPPGETTIS